MSYLCSFRFYDTLIQLVYFGLESDDPMSLFSYTTQYNSMIGWVASMNEHFAVIIWHLCIFVLNVFIAFEKTIFVHSIQSKTHDTLPFMLNGDAHILPASILKVYRLCNGHKRGDWGMGTICISSEDHWKSDCG